jgi:hypothetical protein
MNGRLARRPFSRSLRRTVAELMRGLCLSGVSLAVDTALLNRFSDVSYHLKQVSIEF